MKWYVLLAHPNPESFNHAVCRAFLEGLDEAGATWTLNDLYANGFNPIMGMDDFQQFIPGGKMPADVLAEQKKVETAKALALVYPVWWNEAPAILKGWIDRVLSKGWAYDFTPEGKFHQLLSLDRVVIFNTADQPTEFLEESGVNPSARLTKDLGTFGFCGVEPVEHYILGNCSLDPDARRMFLEEVRQRGRAS
ncbi:MAG: NAD(P)H-dependent oxidoreductase [Thermodesulfobacteriota bacterium]